MDIDVAKKIIKNYTVGHEAFTFRSMEAERYYSNENDILKKKPREVEKEENPLRNADNRIPHNFHGLLVNQKASYMFTAPPLFDVGNTTANKNITQILGDRYAKNCKDLCINASNCGIGWLHYWINEKGLLEYAVVDSKQVIPIWTMNLNKELSAVVRVYEKLDDDGKTYIIYEIWTDAACQAFYREINATIDEGLMMYSMFSTLLIDTNTMEKGNEYTHNFETVPFIPFYNNNLSTSDLKNIKQLIDTYDAVYSGFVNDLEDIQEIIFILSGYTGTDLSTFLHDLKKYKTVKLDDDEGKPGLSSLTIDIPVEAREKLLTMTRKEIFEQGQGVDPQPDSFGNKSGEALKFMYALLELKAGLAETEFRLGFGELIRAICKFLNDECQSITQTWTRTSIRNEKELAEIASNSVGIISQKTILKNHPWVEDADLEVKQIEEDQAKELDYNNLEDQQGGGVGGKE